MTAPGVNLQLLLSTAAAQRQLQTDMRNAAGRAGQQASSEFERSFRPRNIIADALPFAASALAARGIGLIVKSAQQYEQSLNAVGQVFGNLSGDMKKYVDSQARGLGLAKGQLLDYQAQFGSILRGLELSTPAAAKFTNQLVEAGAALAAFRNTSVDQAINALQAGFRGEYDSLQRFIPEVSDLTLRNRALAMGLADTRTEVTQQDKALALLDVVQKSVGRSAGEAERRQGNLQTSLAKVQAQGIDTATAIGRTLLPVLKSTTDAVAAVNPVSLLAAGAILFMGRRMTQNAAAQTGFTYNLRASTTSSYALTTALQRQQTVFANMTVTQAIANRSAILANNQIIGSATAVQGSVTGAGASLGRFAGQAAAAASSGSLAARSMGLLGVAARGAGAGLAATTAALGGPFTLALVAATIGIGYLITTQQKQAQKTRQAKEAVKSYAEQIAELGNSASRAALELSAKELIDRGMAARADRAGISLSLLTKAYAGQADAVSDLNEALSEQEALLIARRAEARKAGDTELEQSINKQLSDLRTLREELGVNGKALEDAKNKTDLYTRATTENAEALKLVRDRWGIATEALKNYNDAQDILLQGQQEFLDAQVAYEAAIDATTEAIKENGTTLDITTAKGRDNVQNVRDIIQAAYDQAEADIQRTGTISAQTQARIDGLERELIAMGFNKKEIETILALYKTVPPEVVTQVKVLGGADAKNELNTLGKAAGDMIAKYNLTPTEAMGLVQGRDPRAVFNSPASARGRAMGGRIYGPGGPTDDKAGLYALSNKEMVIRAKAVETSDRVYGPQAIEQYNQTGIFPGTSVAGAFAKGGRVDVGQNVNVKGIQSWPILINRLAALQAGKEKQLKAAQAAAGIWDGTIAPGAIGEMQKWALGQRGGKYLWTGVQSGLMDCSGMVGNLWAIATGNPLYRRYFTTHNMGPGRFGMESGPGNFTIYLKQGGGGGGHTAANVGGLHVEAYGGNGTPFAIGHVGTRLSYYDQVLHLAGLAAGGRTSDPGNSVSEQIRSFYERGWPEPPDAVLRKAPYHYAMDRGGVLNPGDIAKNYGNRPEAVLDADQTVRFEALTEGRVPIELGQWTIDRIVQALKSQPNVIAIDGRELARTTLERGVY